MHNFMASVFSYHFFSVKTTVFYSPVEYTISTLFLHEALKTMLL